MIRQWIVACALGVTVLVALVVWRLSDHDLDWRQSERFNFTSGGASISGTLWLPERAAHAAVVLVHGDGPQDRVSGGGYAPLINVFLDQGIAVASWDKPGVGASGGNWLHQSMADRASETSAALSLLNQRFDDMALGAVGFSQAGWVLPQLTRRDADFLVMVGPAVSWQDQGDYYTRVRLAQDGLDPEMIQDIIVAQTIADDHAFGSEAQVENAPTGMSVDRWHFIRENRDADARLDLAQLDLPLLAMWGADDLNVDAENDAALYRKSLEAGGVHNKIILWPAATHGLLKSAAYNWQLTEDWSPFAIARFLAEGRFAFAPGALDEITGWIKERNQI
ncbi:Alpha/beta hydrolase family protein (plasmid) [Phaeobacter inhibens]|uniref:Alpha/beta hydrolase family protein n=2 Tax=Phaeobacter inhibens TaxID=221822 RepID=A0ABN5GTR1_9RHOB|nr:alpha/beta hydrolase [Phaeobacter inhibens]AUQ52398.1 Alpha/beta hydrolase family protein [Phaeobacter inhibens]AUQ97003.1 Alpha/beta hydrolase family protein [Phaeobacter inhibens]AUR22203.1 Alpha/beta hydrolase family protein [Phaeobacter inhibens]UWR90400.1 lysophospholipase [Phaeobacter inhibens]